MDERLVYEGSIREANMIHPPPSLFASNLIDDGTATLRVLRERCKSCRACGLASTRTNTVFGVGRGNQPILAIVGEGPGEREDEQGVPFVGKSGVLLDQMIEAMELRRDDIYIVNVVACRPPGNRTPTDEEQKACAPFFLGQLRAVRPRIILTLGATASRALAKGAKPLSELRGQWLSWNDTPLRVSYHPAYLLRFPAAKEDAWKDLQAVMRKIKAMESL